VISETLNLFKLYLITLVFMASVFGDVYDFGSDRLQIGNSGRGLFVPQVHSFESLEDAMRYTGVSNLTEENQRVSMPDRISQSKTLRELFADSRERREARNFAAERIYLDEILTRTDFLGNEVRGSIISSSEVLDGYFLRAASYYNRAHLCTRRVLVEGTGLIVGGIEDLQRAVHIMGGILKSWKGRAFVHLAVRACLDLASFYLRLDDADTMAALSAATLGTGYLTRHSEAYLNEEFKAEQTYASKLLEEIRLQRLMSGNVKQVIES
jgi:hypothetical protein